MNTVDIFIARYQRGDEPTDIQLNRAEEIIGGFKSSLIYDNINKVIELYNAKNIFDLALKKSLLNESALNKYNHVIREINSTIAKFVANINGENFNNYYDQTESYCKGAFWVLIEHYGVFFRISENQFFNIISHTIASIGSILQCKKIVLHFDKEFVQVFKDKIECAELIISYYANQENSLKNQIYILQMLK